MEDHSAPWELGPSTFGATLLVGIGVANSCAFVPEFLLGGRTSASTECRHWSGRAVRWPSCAILLSLSWLEVKTTPVRRRPAIAFACLRGSGLSPRRNNQNAPPVTENPITKETRQRRIFVSIRAPLP
jgi:hypothetical protein